MIVLRDKEFSNKKSRKELEDEYKEQSEKFQKKAAPGAGIMTGIPAAGAGIIAGGEIGEHLAEKTKAAKKAGRIWDRSLDIIYDAGRKGKAEAAGKASRVSRQVGTKIAERGRAAGMIAGGVGAGIAGYQLGKKAFKSGVKRGDKKFLEMASDEKVKEATETIKKNLDSKKKK